MEYLKEPFDFKLFILQMLRKWKHFVIWTLLGALIFGGSYFLVKVVYAPAREYKAEAVYYIEYAHDPGTGEMYTYFNDYTLNSWLTMDAFVDKVRPKLSVAVTGEELDAYVELTIPSDVRVVYLTVTTPTPKLALELLAAYDEAFQAFGEAQREIDRIERQDRSGEARQIIADIRTQRAFILGALLGLFTGSMYIILKYLLDDGIYLPGMLHKRHGLTVFGADLSEELAANVTYAVRDPKRVAVTGIGEAPALPDVVERLKAAAPDAEWVCVPSMIQCPEAGEVLRGCDGVIVTVMSGQDKSAAIDRALRYYAEQDVVILGAVLWNADAWLLKKYER